MGRSITGRRGGLAGRSGSPRLSLRPATTDDVRPIAELWHLGWIDGHRCHASDELLRHRRRGDFDDRVPELVPLTTVATVEQRLVGFVTVRDDEIEQLYVAADARGSGAADALIEHGEQVIAQRFPIAWLAVATGNARARRFYERSGWTDAGAIDDEARSSTGTISVPCRRYEKRRS
jgi:ribosomal protein S18 acetylase RimI-like enzyme